MLIYHVLFYYYVLCSQVQLVAMETNQLLQNVAEIAVLYFVECEQEPAGHWAEGEGRRKELLWTHHILTDTTAADLEVVPRDEQDQEEGQHVKLPVPHCHHEHLQAEGHRGIDYMSSGQADEGQPAIIKALFPTYSSSAYAMRGDHSAQLD